ncbi:MFS transporter [Halococcus sp. IIIV-5B]|uniref:MFS transporter n=1 Tax=Halococcus sp. IIIV-5B TaxID=2321230 RepID=UPI000E74A41F|nr:MFS transporter [Halococcus sp. IIIV-5B]RJT04739.1 MFS transporter [Halococcus sp. IIIV-5B]
MSAEDESLSVFDPFRQFFSLRRDVLVLSVAMLAFSLAFQMTGRYIPEYMRVLGAGAGVIGAYGSVSNLISAVYPYPGGALSDRIGSRFALTGFAVISTVGFGVWWLVPELSSISILSVTVPVWIWVFIGLFLTQAWNSFGLGATFAIVKQSVAPEHLAMGFASTEVFRRIGFLIGPLLAAAVLASTVMFVDGFQVILLIALGFGVAATIVQHILYDASEDSIGKSFEGIQQILNDLRTMPETLRPLLVADTFIRFGNGMVYVFWIIVVTDFLNVGFQAFGVTLEPAAFFGVLLGVEMLIAILTKVPVSKLAEYTGLKPVVSLGFVVYAVFPIMLINVPANQWLLVALFAFSGLRFAGLPAHKALIAGPAERDTSGRVTGTYYLVRNTVVIPSAAIGGWLYSQSPNVAFALATVVGLIGVGYFAVFGKEFEAYARTA